MIVVVAIINVDVAIANIVNIIVMIVAKYVFATLIMIIKRKIYFSLNLINIMKINDLFYEEILYLFE